MWGVIEERHNGQFVAYHVVPMVELGGELVCSDAHIISDACHCHPYLSKGQGGWDIFNHFDPDHVGALSAVEWVTQKRNWVN